MYIYIQYIYICENIKLVTVVFFCDSPTHPVRNGDPDVDQVGG